MTRSSRYALPGAERGTGTISAGQRWYGWTRKERPGFLKRCVNTSENRAALASNTPLKRPEEVAAMPVWLAPHCAMQTPRVSGGDEA